MNHQSLLYCGIIKIQKWQRRCVLHMPMTFISETQISLLLLLLEHYDDYDLTTFTPRSQCGLQQLKPSDKTVLNRLQPQKQGGA